MKVLRRQWLVWALLACLVLVNGLMAAPSVVHAGHHEKHTAGSHTTGLCAWLCAAGQGIETSSSALEATFRVIDEVFYFCIDHPLRPLSAPIFLRGPPASAR